MKYTYKHIEKDKVTIITTIVDEDNNVETTQEEVLIKEWEEQELDKYY
tara:strand:+ start:265 stop:408 length:144 start_codon:yes stop_codon:yes gene_type:complete